MEQEVISILKNFAGINKTMRIDEGNTIRIFNNKISLYAEAYIDEGFPKTFSIYDLNQLLSAMSLFDNPTLEYDNKQIIMTSGRMSAKYRYSSPSTTLDQPTAFPNLQNEIFSFKIPKEQLAEIIKASAVLNLKQLQISTKGLRALTLDSSGEAIDNEFTTAIHDVSNPDEETIVSVKIESLKMMILDYNVSVTPSAIVFTSSDGKLKYCAALVKN